MRDEPSWRRTRINLPFSQPCLAASSARGGIRTSVTASNLREHTYEARLSACALSCGPGCRGFAEGEAGPGERLPLAKDLAAVLGVNKNTVLRALRILRDEGLLEFRRGRGITVAGTPQRGAVLARTRDLLEFARQHGFGRDEIIQIIQSLP
ncbi:MAG TPA: GntR family transcriptional regulator [Streptosporangiaceae bacterium]